MNTCIFNGSKHEIMDFIQEYPYPCATTLIIRILDGSKPYTQVTHGGPVQSDTTTVREGTVSNLRMELDDRLDEFYMEQDLRAGG